MLSLFWLIALLATAAGLLGNFFLTETNITEPVSLAIVDIDDSFETRMILSAITEGAGDYEGILKFSHLSRESANTALQNGYVSAIITLPENFGSAMISGENIPFIVTYNAERPLSAALVRVSAHAFADMLRTSQMGVYVTLNYARTQDIPQDSFDMIFMGVNIRFLRLVLNRGSMFEVDTQSVTGGLLIWQSYFIAAYIALMICAAFVMTDALRRNFGHYCLLSLKNRGIAPHMVFGACTFAYFILFFALNSALWLLVSVLPAVVCIPQFPMSVNFFAGIVIISILLSAFSAMLVFVFENTFSAGFFTSAFAIVSLFLSGGIIPVMYFSDSLQAASNLMWSTWGTRLLAAAFLDENIVWQAVANLAFGLVFAGIGYVAVCLRGRVAG